MAQFLAFHRSSSGGNMRTVQSKLPMDLTPTLTPLIWIILKIFAALAAFALVLGLIAGLFTYGRPIKRVRNPGILDDILRIGMNLSHLLIGYVIRKIKGGSRSGTWLNDQEILAMMRGMHPSEFEAFVARLFSALGYNTKLNGGSGDGGIDIALTKDGRNHLVQCKKFITRKVAPRDVRDFFGAMGDRHVNGKGFFVTTNIFTLEAERFAEGKPIELIDGIRLISLVRESGVLGNQPQSPPQAPSGDVCPSCGNTLVMKTNRSNGKRFLGCSRYPACRFTKDV